MTDPTSPTEPPPSLEILGVRVASLGPIDDVAVALDGSVTVLYGLNGAGKTYLLRGIAKALGCASTEAQGGTCDLHVRWHGHRLAAIPHSDFDPWRALLRSMREVVRERLSSGWEIRTVSATELAVRWWRIHFPDEGVHTGREFNKPLVELLALLALQANLDEFYFDDAVERRDADSPPSIFWPAIEAFNEGRLILGGGSRPTVTLGVAEEGAETRRWSNVVAEAFAKVAEESTVRAWADVDAIVDDAADPLTEELVDRIAELGLGWNADLAVAFSHWRSSLAAGAGLDPHPPWCVDPLCHGMESGGELPVAAVAEWDTDLDLTTLRDLSTMPPSEISHSVAAIVSAEFEGRILAGRGDPDLANLLMQESTGVAASPKLFDLAARLASRANELYRELLPVGPTLSCDVRPIYEWKADGPLRWSAQHGAAVALPLAALSGAEQRWALFAIRLADTLLATPEGQASFALIDEPEQGLHRRAERHLAEGLARINALHGVRFIVASHSPSLLRIPEATPLHVYRTTTGATAARPMPPDLRARAAELGLDPADLLQHTRCILLVEGQHELIILEELLGDEFDRLGVEMLCMRGAKALKTWDAQLLERFTDVPIVVLVDNDQADRLRGVWKRAQDSAARGQMQSAREIVDEMKSGGRGSEGEFLRELCKELLQRNDTERYHITAFDKPDIPEYLRPAEIAAAVGPDATWDGLRQRASGAKDFKSWMKKQYDADYSDESLRAAVSNLDEIPTDFVELLQELGTLTRSGATAPGG